jgi:hypothetical protein
MRLKGIERRIRHLVAAAPEAPLAYQAAEVLRHWHETGELTHPDGSRISVAVFRQVAAAEELRAQKAAGAGRPVQEK